MMCGPAHACVIAQEGGGRRGRVQHASGARGLPAALARAGAAPELGGTGCTAARAARRPGRTAPL